MSHVKNHAKIAKHRIADSLWMNSKHAHKLKIVNAQKLLLSIILWLIQANIQ